MDTAYIAIGRGAGPRQMSSHMWHQFTEDVRDLVKKFNGQIHTTAYGRGEWEGQQEDSFIVGFTDADLNELQGELPRLAYLYSQDAIAFVIGVCILVMA